MHARPVLHLLLALALSATIPAGEVGRYRLDINPVWRFKLGAQSEEAATPGFPDMSWELVSLPHTHQVFPADLSGFAEQGRQVGWYRRTLAVPPGWAGKRVFIEFQGAMQATTLWVNGARIGAYAVSGYDSFHFDITTALKPGANCLAVKIDNTVNPTLPPDGQKTDFIQFGGLYRDVSIVVTGPVHVTFPWEAAKAGVRLTLPEISAERAVIRVETTVRNDGDQERSCALATRILDGDGAEVAAMREVRVLSAGQTVTVEQRSAGILRPRLWSPDDPYLYRVQTVVEADGVELDRLTTRMGVRWVEWSKDQGFLLNGKHLKLVGANRHQTWPFIGNALPNALHRFDAEMLKGMGCNWVRCSHYPHDPDYLDALDELGILALEEGPTWMKTGGKEWMDNLEASFRSMIRRDRNHPSIIIWNACVNHSGANPRLVAAATAEDPDRARGQDTVPCPMNFKHKSISGKGALCIEHTGHTFDTARGDIGKPGKAPVSWVASQATVNREYELALRHWEHTDAAYKVPGNAGLAVWAQYDYNTFHNATEGIARHGVLDLFRIPKHSYWWHVSELTVSPMAYVIRIDPTRVCVFSNCEEVRLSQDAGGGLRPVVTRKPDAGTSLRHPPFHFEVDPQAAVITAEGLVGGVVKATAAWRMPGRPASLRLQADRATITADGADITRIEVAAIDAAGTIVPTVEQAITFTIAGAGQLVGENPVTLRAGRMIILVQSGFVPGSITVGADANGMSSASMSLAAIPPGPGVDMPRIISAAAPTATRLVVHGGRVAIMREDVLSFAPRVGVTAGQWIESDPIMVNRQSSLAITGGEYRIYTAPWTARSGNANGGDAVFVRVKAPEAAGATATVVLTVGDRHVPFTVTTTR